MAEAILNGLWQGILLTAAVGVCLRIIPKTNAATRYGIWLVTLSVVSLLPVVNMPAPVRGAASNQVVTASAAPSSSLRLTVPVQAVPGRWPPLLGAVWALVWLALAVRLANGYRCARRLKRSGSPAAQQGRLDHWREACGVTRKVHLALSPEVSTPLSAGLTSPVILLPADHAAQLTEAELDQVILHEMAHIGRWDDWTKLAQKLVETVFFFHPAVVWIGRRLSLEREIACDDWVVALTGERRSYASCLTRLIELSTASGPAVALGAALTRKQLSRRIEMLLDKSRNAAPRLYRLGLAIAVVVLVAGGVVAALMAPRLSFEALAQEKPPADDSRVRELEQQVRQLQDKLAKDLEPQMREFQKQIERLHQEKLRSLEPKVREIEQEARKLQEDAFRDLEPQMREYQKQMERLQEEKMRSLEPRLRELEERGHRLREEAQSELEPHLRKLQRQMEALQEERLRAIEPKIRELEERARKGLQTAP